MSGPTARGDNFAQAWLQPAMLAAIRLYQVALRLVNPWGCKFHPSCSNYAREAIERHGPVRGLWLAVGRLLRCRPGVFGGFDPVPEKLSQALCHSEPLPAPGGEESAFDQRARTKQPQHKAAT
jgi:putative membrane protein insertion efficiency factor